MLARRDEIVPVGLTDSFTPVHKRGSRSNKARFFLAATSITALVVAAILVAGSVKSDSGFVALSQSSQYDDERVVEKFDDLTHKVRGHHTRCNGQRPSSSSSFPSSDTPSRS